MSQVMQDLVIKAMELAAKYHDGQVDKAGEPYIDHCIRVGVRAGLKAEKREDFFLLMAIGVLHDIIEDTEMTLENLSEEMNNETVVEAVTLLTRMKEQVYFDYIDVLTRNRWAVLVKLADVEDHLEHPNGYVLPDTLTYRYRTAKKQLMESEEYLKHIHGYYN